MVIGGPPWASSRVRSKVVDAGGRQLQPAQVGFEMEQGVVGEQADGHRGGPPQCRQLPHPSEMGVAFGIDDPGDVATRHDGQDDLREEGGLEMRLRVSG